MEKPEHKRDKAYSDQVGCLCNGGVQNAKKYRWRFEREVSKHGWA